MDWRALFKKYHERFQTQEAVSPRVQFLNDFIVIDVETTGLSPQTDTMIQLSAVHYQNHSECESFSTYLNPYCHIPTKVTELTGIDDSTVANAPAFEEIADPFYQFIEQAPVLTGYNFSFDLRFLSSAAGFQLAEKYRCFDTLNLARQGISGLCSYKLCEVSSYIGFQTKFHNSLNDCRACGEVLNYLCSHTEPSCLQIRYCTKSGCCQQKSSLRRYQEQQRNSNCPVDIERIVPNGQLLHKRIVFTGLLSFGRIAAIEMAERAGAEVKASVSGKTDYLVVGKQDCSLVGEDGHSSKEERAYQLIHEHGAHIQIIDEDTFLRLLCCEEGLKVGAN